MYRVNLQLNSDFTGLNLNSNIYKNVAAYAVSTELDKL